MAGVILVPQDHTKSESAGAAVAPPSPDVPEHVPETGVRKSDEEASTVSWESDSQSSGCDFEGLHAALEDRRDGSAAVRRLELSRIGDKASLFRELAELLAFDHPRVRSECSGMIARIVPHLGKDAELDRCMSIVLPRLVHNLGHAEAEVRESSAHSLVVYLQLVEDERPVMRVLVEQGLLHGDPNLRRTVTAHLSLLFTDVLAEKDWQEVLLCLVSTVVQQRDAQTESLATLQRLRALVGDERFRFYLQHMDADERRDAGDFLIGDLATGERRRTGFGFVEPDVVEMLSERDNWKARVNGIEELKLAVKNAPDMNALLDELPRFLRFLAERATDVNFKVVLVTLEIYGVLVDRLKWRVAPHLDSIVDTLVQLLGENKIVVRTQAARVLDNLMHCSGPSPVVALLCRHLAVPGTGKQNNTKTREEILNAIILALLTFPSYEFDLIAICSAVVPTLLDPKGRVRQAALECLAVLAQAMGSSKLAAVAKAIDDATATDPGHVTEAALAAVLARLARRQLPRITPDGRVEYSLRISSGVMGHSPQSGQGIASFPRGADVDWILAGNSSLGSGLPHYANSTSTISVADAAEGQSNRNKFQSASFPSSPAAPRRIVSPGYGKNSLPWSEGRQNGGSAYSDSSNSVVSGGNGWQAGQSAEDNRRLPKVPSAIAPAGQRSRPNSRPLQLSGTLGNDTNGGSSVNDGLSWTTGLTSHIISNTSKPLSGNSQPLVSALRSGVGSAYHGMIYSMKQPMTDRASCRPLDKVAAMLGNNILPSKLRPVIDENQLDQGTNFVGSTIMPLPPPFNPSSTWPGATPGSLPALPQKRKVLGPITDFRDAPIPTRPTLVRSSSGNKRSRVPPIGQVTLNGSLAAVRSDDPRFTRGYHSSGKTTLAEQQNKPEPKDSQQPSRDANTPDSSFKNSVVSANLKNRGVGGSPSGVAAGHLNRHRRALDSDDEERDVGLLQEYSCARGSVDSGVESLARPRSRSSSAPRRRPRSLDINSAFSFRRYDNDGREVRGGGDGEFSPSSSESQSRGWYDDDEEDGDFGRGRAGVRNRAVSEVSSLASSFEQLPDSESPPFRTLSPLPLPPAPSEHLQRESRRPENRNRGNSEYSTDVSANRVRSTVSWEHELPTPSLDGPQRNSNQEEPGKKFKDDLSAPPPYRSKPVLVHSLSLPRLKRVSPVSSQLSGGAVAPTVNRKATTTIPRPDTSPVNGYLLAPRTRTDRVLLSSSPNANVRDSEDINVIGKGMQQRQHRSSNASDIYAVGSPPLAASPPIPTHRISRSEVQEDEERRGQNASRSSYLPSVEGRGVSQAAGDSSMDGGGFSTEDEDPNAMSLSQSTFNKMMSRKMEMMKEAERRKQERQQRLQEQRKAWLHNQENRKIDTDDKQKNGQPGFRPRTPPGKPAAIRRRPRHVGATVQNGVAVMPSYKDTSGTAHSNGVNERLLKNPDEALKAALGKLQNDEWSVKCEGISVISALCLSHPSALNSELHRVNLALLVEVKNLRSTVSRAAIQAVALLFANAKKNMENDLETICHALLHKSGETNVFIKEDVEKALMQMIENVSPQKAALALVLGGATHRNAAVRRTTAQFLSLACEKLGPNRILSGVKDVTDRIIPTAAQFLMDGSPLTRYYGRKIFFMLLPSAEFDRVLRQHTQPNTLRNIQDILEGLKAKGLGAMPNESASSRHLKGLK